MVKKIHVKDNDIVVPGQLLAEGMSYIPSGKAIRNGESITATVVGKISNKGHVVKVVPLFEKYAPKRGDKIIGKVVSMNNYGWTLDIGVPVKCELDLREGSQSFIETGKMSKFFDVGDLVFVEIIGNRNGTIKVSAKDRLYRRLPSGHLINVDSGLIPRVIGKQGSMINTLKDESGCNVVVGQNGYIYVHCDDVNNVFKVQEAIEYIRTNSDSSGLTEKVKKMLGGKMK